MMDVVDDPLCTVGINLCWVSTLPFYSSLHLQLFQPLALDAHVHTDMLLWLGKKAQNTFFGYFAEKSYFESSKCVGG